MIEYFKADAGVVVALERAEPGCWINLVNPTRKEIDSVIVSQHVDAGFINAALDA